MSHLPSLQTLRAFEAAGRLKSYSKAAEELNLTHGAVSHRIRELEQRLGVTLFKRVGNAMHLTEAGQKLDAQVRQGLSVLEQAFAPPKQAKARTHIVVSSVPSLASTWLFARLAEYRAEHPETDFELRVSERVSDYKKEGIDIGVRLGRGGWAGMHAHKLFDEALTPVCTPAYRDQLKLSTPADLERATLLRNPWTPWALWFRAAGLDWPEPQRGPMFDDGPLLLRAALQGDGVALGRQWLAIDELRAGRLVAPFEFAVRDDFAYWIVWPTARALAPEAARFRDWLEARAAAEDAPCPLPVAGAAA
ncbi:MAG TPA: transcriptional regulator GcvA [Vitreimonas sp.]|uniref:transcriptional regulator GcvA n=1 Tax=Vitreimonas sp. TaxID=3069702 RepID=UPI002D22F842|nr:transcriptional regulator GcvA [Vitreimonas sp.]HYD87585.1 transcriptional regulator GcvA [Vitreimonas sp.]